MKKNNNFNSPLIHQKAVAKNKTKNLFVMSQMAMIRTLFALRRAASFFEGRCRQGEKHFILRTARKTNCSLRIPVNVCVRSISESAPLLARMKSRRSENCSNTGPIKANGRMSIRTSRAGGRGGVSARRQSARGRPKWRHVTLRGQAPRLKHT